MVVEIPTAQNSSYSPTFIERNEVQYNGLKNQGATCYLNAVLQCLFMTPEFRHAVEESCKKAAGDCGKDTLLSQLQKLFRRLSENVATNEGITKSLGINNVYEQQDAVEYYRKILKAVGRASKVFEGKMSNKTKCICGEDNKETNSFISILLSIENGNNDKYNVEKGLETFLKHSKLDEDDWMYCDKCDRKSETETWTEIDEYPTVLTLHLKRFDFDYTKMIYVKNECALDVSLSLCIKDIEYDLYAVINHKGGYSGGHYDALIRSDQNQKWYTFDDCTVIESSEVSLQGSSLPYMLMYRKRGPDMPQVPIARELGLPLTTPSAGISVLPSPVVPSPVVLSPLVSATETVLLHPPELFERPTTPPEMVVAAALSKKVEGAAHFLKGSKKRRRSHRGRRQSRKGRRGHRCSTRGRRRL